MLPSNGVASSATPSGVVRIGATVPQSITIVIDEREFVGYVWGKRMPRMIEARVRQAAMELDEAQANYGEPPPAVVDSQFIGNVRSILDATPPEAGAPELKRAIAALQEALVEHDELLGRQRQSVVLWAQYLTKVLCAMVDGLSPLLADQLVTDEVTEILGALHFPGFWRDPDRTQDPQIATPSTEETTPTKTKKSTGSTSKPESPASPESALTSSAG